MHLINSRAQKMCLLIQRIFHRATLLFKDIFERLISPSDDQGNPTGRFAKRITNRELRKLPAKTRYGCNSYFKGNLVKVVCIYKECFAYSKHASGEICDYFV
ncbi:hypothetical protein COOONC_02956 [Cooperia oncophora]